MLDRTKPSQAQQIEWYKVAGIINVGVADKVQQRNSTISTEKLSKSRKEAHGTRTVRIYLISTTTTLGSEKERKKRVIHDEANDGDYTKALWSKNKSLTIDYTTRKTKLHNQFT